MTNNFYGSLPQTILDTDVDRCLEELAIAGFTVMKDVVQEPELAELRRKLDLAYQVQEGEVKPEFTLADVNEENQVRAPLCYDDHFLEKATQPQVLEVLKRTLGNYFLIHLQIGIINMPNVVNRQSVWHRDLLYQDFVISRPLSVSAMLCIDDFSVATGGTRVVPFSHRVERTPSKEFIEKTAVTVEAKAGSIFMMDSMLIHKAGFNSSGQIRRGLNTIYASGLLKQQISFQSQLKGKHKEDPFLNMLLGYDAEASPSVAAWRKRRYDKLNKK